MHTESLVFKGGQATNVTVGYVNKIKQDNNHTSGWSQAVTRQSYVVVSPLNESNIGAGGDSGAWLVDTEGKLLGMLHGGNNYDKTCFIIPIDAILTDIEKVAGMTPSLKL